MAEAVGVAASALAVVELSVKVASLCLQFSKDVKYARDDISRINREVINLKNAADQVQQLLHGPQGVKLQASQKLVLSLKESRSELETLQIKLSPSETRKTKRFWLRALKWPFESKDIDKIVQNLTRYTHTISLSLQVEQTVILLDIQQKTVLDKLPIAEGAAFDSHAEEHNPTCHPATRVDLLREISEWVENPRAEAVFWLNGMAGTGKSTISRTIAHCFSQRGQLGGSFFFKRGEGDRGGISRFFTTIAAQLVLREPSLAYYMQIAIDTDPTILGKAMLEQFQKLILEPLSKIADTTLKGRPLLIVVDALDECEREDDVTLLIKLFSSIETLPSRQLRIFLTSRPELPIRLGFSAIKGRYQDLVLHDIPEPVIEHDISIFLEHELARVRHTYNSSVSVDRELPVTWPDKSDIQILVTMAVPLFIFAATVCRFLANRRGGNPDKQLRKVLDRSKGQESKLDATYLPVLDQLLVDLSPSEEGETLE